MPLLDQAWPRPINSYDTQTPRILLVEFADIPGTYLAHFNDVIHMNAVFQRASAYIEFNSGIVSGVDLFGIVAGGHDLRGEALLRFWQASEESMAKDLKASLGMSATTRKTYLNRLNLEREFFNSIIRPTLRERGTQPSVFLASNSDRGAKSIVSHEMWHGKYFTNPQWAAAVSDYYVNHLSAEDQEAFKLAIQYVGYDPNDLDLMINEHQAYMLQFDSPYFIPSANTIRMNQAIARLRPPFFEFLRSRGYGHIIDARNGL